MKKLLSMLAVSTLSVTSGTINSLTTANDGTVYAGTLTGSDKGNLYKSK